MTINRGWSDAIVPSRGQFYSRFVDRKHKRGVQWVAKHTGRVYQNVVKVNGIWEGRGFLGIEPRYANLSGSDSKLESSPRITKNQLDRAQKTGKTIKFNIIKLRKPAIIRPSLRR